MIGFCRADMSRPVGGGGCDGTSGFFNQGTGNGVGWKAQPHTVQPRTRQVTDGAVFRPRHHQGQGARPKSLGKLQGKRIEATFALSIGMIGNMGDQRIELRAALGGIKRRNGLGIGGIRAQSVDGFRGKSDKLA